MMNDYGFRCFGVGAKEVLNLVAHVESNIPTIIIMGIICLLRQHFDLISIGGMEWSVVQFFKNIFFKCEYKVFNLETFFTSCFII